MTSLWGPKFSSLRLPTFEFDYDLVYLIAQSTFKFGFLPKLIHRGMRTFLRKINLVIS